MMTQHVTRIEYSNIVYHSKYVSSFSKRTFWRENESLFLSSFVSVDIPKKHFFSDFWRGSHFVVFSNFYCQRLSRDSRKCLRVFNQFSLPAFLFSRIEIEDINEFQTLVIFSACPARIAAFQVFEKHSFLFLDLSDDEKGVDQFAVNPQRDIFQHAFLE
jgi:hypothetical protein